MNCWKAEAEPHGSGFFALVRRVDKPAPYRLSEKGTALIFSSETEALIAGYRHLIDLWNGDPRFELFKPSASLISLEEKAFGTVTSRKGKAKVERRRNRMRKRERQARREAGG